MRSATITRKRATRPSREIPRRFIFGSENAHGYLAWAAVRDTAYVGGQFLWTGIDCLGEAHQWPNRAADFDLLDLCVFKKPAAWFRQPICGGGATSPARHRPRKLQPAGLIVPPPTMPGPTSTKKPPRRKSPGAVSFSLVIAFPTVGAGHEINHGNRQPRYDNGDSHVTSRPFTCRLKRRYRPLPKEGWSDFNQLPEETQPLPSPPKVCAPPSKASDASLYLLPLINND